MFVDCWSLVMDLGTAEEKSLWKGIFLCLIQVALASGDGGRQVFLDECGRQTRLGLKKSLSDCLDPYGCDRAECRGM